MQLRMESVEDELQHQHEAANSTKKHENQD